MSVIDSLSLGGTTYSLRDNDGRAIIAGTESSTTSAHAYSAGDYFILNDTLYEATASIAVGGTITVGTNCQATTVCGEVGQLKSEITQLKNYVTPEMYGAVGDGETDDTEAMQAAIDAAVLAKGKLILTAGKTYLVSTVILSNGITEIGGNGVLKGNGGDVAVLSLGGGSYNETPANDCIVSVSIDMSEGNEYGIRGIGVSGCAIRGCRIYGFTNSTTVSRFGISLENAACNNSIVENAIVGYENPDHTMAHVGIRIISVTEDYGGYFSEGGVVDSESPSVNNLIANNYIAYGESAVILLGNESTIVTGNHCYKQSTRAIYCANAEHNSVVSDNNIVGFAASAVLLGYGCHNNTISNNAITQISGYNTYGGEAAINIICGCFENTIIANKIDAMTNYGIYIAVNAQNNVITNNTVKGYYIAGITMESDWEANHDQEASYSRPNYSAPPVGDNWASADTSGNTIQENIIDAGYTGRMPCSLYVAQIGSIAGIKNNIVDSNRIIHPQLSSSWSIRWFEKTSGMMSDNVMTNNSVKDVNVQRQYMTRGKAHFYKCYGNDGIDTAKISFPTTGGTPSVGKGYYFVCQYTTATNVTDFIDCMEGQTILVKLNANTTIVQAGAKIQLKGATNVTGSTGIITFKRIHNVWMEVARNF